MISRKQIEKQYQIENGIIISKGLFEHCPIFIPYFWEYGVMNMDDTEYSGEWQDEYTTEQFRFNITDEDREIFPEIKDSIKGIEMFLGCYEEVRYEFRYTPCPDCFEPYGGHRFKCPTYGCNQLILSMNLKE